MSEPPTPGHRTPSDPDANRVTLVSAGGTGANAANDLEDLREGLSQRPRSIPSRLFYDAAGSALFERICELPEYYQTRTERALIERIAETVLQRCE